MPYAAPPRKRCAQHGPWGRGLLLACACLVLVGVAWAEDPPAPTPPAPVPAPAPAPTPAPAPAPPQPAASPEKVADDVKAAFAAGDTERLSWLAAAAEPDPWLVADELLGRGEHDAALAFAKAAERPDTQGLPAYLAARKGKPDDPARRARLVAGNAALKGQRFQEVLDVLGPAEEGPPEDVPGLRLRALRVFALANLGRDPDAGAAFLALGTFAEQWGWLARSTTYFELAARQAFETARPQQAVDPLERLAALARRRGQPQAQLMALAGLGEAYAARGDAAASVGALERMLALAEESGAPMAQAQASSLLGSRLLDLGQGARAAPLLERAAGILEPHGERLEAADAWLRAGVAWSESGAVDKAVLAWARAQKLGEALGDLRMQALALLSAGFALSDGPQRDDTRALDMLQRAQELTASMGDPALEAQACMHLGALHARRIERVEARHMYERAIELREKLGDERELAALLIDAAERFATGLMHDESLALPWLERGVAQAERAGEKRWVANGLLHLGDLHLAGKRLPQAREAYERSLAVAVEAGERPNEAAAHLCLGRVHLNLLEPKGALASIDRALAILEPAGQRAGCAEALEVSAQAHAMQGAFPQAIAAFQRALEISAPTGLATLTAKLLRGLTDIYLQTGDIAKAVATAKRALTYSEGRGDREGTSAALLSLGVALRNQGAYARSLEATERAHHLQRELGDGRGAAMTLANLGVIYCDLGQWERALGLYQRALAELEALGSADNAAIVLGNIGSTYVQLGNPDKGLETLQKALAAWQALGDASGMAHARLAVGEAHRAQGDLPTALAEVERALTELEASGERSKAGFAQVTLGRIHAQLGERAKAIQSFERAARAAEKLGVTGVLALALSELAAQRLAAGDAGRAVAEAHRAVDLVKNLVGGLGAEQSASVRGGYADLFATGVAAAAALGDAAEASFFLESGRAGALLEALDVRNAMRWAGVPDELKEAETQARLQESRAFAAWSKASEGSDRALTRERLADLEAARAAVAQVLERIQRAATKESQLAYPVATPMEDVQALLGEGEALVLYGLAPHAAPAHALVLTSADARVVALGPSAEVRTACEALEAGRAGSEVAPALARLKSLLVEPLALPAGTRRLLISPDGALAYVPFAALLPDLELAYVASGSTYGVLRAEVSEPGTKVLALGDPDYTSKFDPVALDLYGPRAARDAAATRDAAPAGNAAPAADAGPTRGRRLLPLPGTRAEVLAVGDVRLLGKEASEAGLLAANEQQTGTWRAVHFACHGLVDPDRPALSSLALTPEGVNDGFLTSHEVLRMDLRANLVVLSACETAKGQIASGEGIVGLTRSFMFAGSPRVLCSLWKVDDEATSALMVRFYELWNPRAAPEDPERAKRGEGAPGTGLSAAQALREAQAFIRAQERWKHPYFWAAWVLWGVP